MSPSLRRPTSRIPSCPGRFHTAAAEIESLGGRALPLAVDIRSEDQVADAIARTVAAFGGIDILVNNASAIHLADVQHTDIRRFDLMHAVNTRGSLVVSKLRFRISSAATTRTS
jgi:citronellol/citronellal dehydrogenase